MQTAPVEEASGAPLFEDITAALGIRHRYPNGENSGEHSKHLAIVESPGGGMGLIAFDGDRLLDVFLPGGGDVTGKEQIDIGGRPCQLYCNLGGGKFTDVAAAAGFDTLPVGPLDPCARGYGVVDFVLGTELGQHTVRGAT